MTTLQSGIKLTADIINERLSSRGIMMIGEYKNTDTKTLFRCSMGHEWIVKPYTPLRGCDCPTCAKIKLVLTTEVVNERIKHKGFELIGEYVSANTKALFRCSNGHEWWVLPSHVMKDRGCPHCSNIARLTTEIVNERIAARGIKMISAYVNAQTVSLFECSLGHQWKASPHNVSKAKTGCPHCAKYGFNQSKPAYSYVLDFGAYIKYGITNNLITRMNRHRSKNGAHRVVEVKEYETGIEALLWEREVKAKFGGNYATKEQCPDGFTETLAPDMLSELLAFTIKR